MLMHSPSLRVTIIGIWRNLPPVMTEKQPPNIPSWHTRRRVTLPWQNYHRRTPSGSGWPWTSASSITRSSTVRTGRAGWRRLHLMTLSQNWTHFRRRAIRTAHWSCSFWGTISHCGPAICKGTVSKVHFLYFLSSLGRVWVVKKVQNTQELMLCNVFGSIVFVLGFFTCLNYVFVFSW